MFERFTQGAKRVVIDAQEEARRLRHDHVGTKHMLLALTTGDDVAAETLEAAGVTHTLVEGATVGNDLDDDTEALGALGIDLEEVKRSVESAFGEGALARGPASRKSHLPFTNGAKKILELSLREAIHLRHKRIGAEHILLGLLRDEKSSAHAWLVGGGFDVDSIRRTMVERMKHAS